MQERFSLRQRAARAGIAVVAALLLISGAARFVTAADRATLAPPATVTTPIAGRSGTAISVMLSARGTVTWKTPPPTSRPDRPRACSITLVSSEGPVVAGGADAGAPRGVALPASACRRLRASCTAWPCPA